jgi:hypothetical protein
MTALQDKVSAVRDKVTAAEVLQQEVLAAFAEMDDATVSRWLCRSVFGHERFGAEFEKTAHGLLSGLAERGLITSLGNGQYRRT